jgi:hypothetical protein
LPDVEEYKIASSQLFQFRNGYVVFYRFFTYGHTENLIQKLIYFDKDKVVDLSDKLPNQKVFKVNISNQYLYVIISHQIQDKNMNMM